MPHIAAGHRSLVTDKKSCHSFNFATWLSIFDFVHTKKFSDFTASTCKLAQYRMDGTNLEYEVGKSV